MSLAGKAKYLIVLVSACSALGTIFFLGTEEKKQKNKKKFWIMDTYTFWLDINVIILKFSKQSYTHAPPPWQHCIASAI